MQQPEVCLKAEGAQPGNPVCSEIDKATWNGQWGDGSEEDPWPLVMVEAGKCYRLRFIGMMGQAQNFQVSENNFSICFLLEISLRGFPFQISCSFDKYRTPKHNTNHIFQRTSRSRSRGTT